MKSEHSPGRIANAAAELPEEIEVTPAMVRAGIEEMRLRESADGWPCTVTAIYRAMEAARCDEKIALSDPERPLGGTVVERLVYDHRFDVERSSYSLAGLVV